MTLPDNAGRRSALGALAALACAAAPNGRTAAAAAPDGIVAALIDTAPWTSMEAPSSAKGIMVELVEELASLSGVPINIIRVPYAREVLMIEKGSAVLTVALRTTLMERIAVPLVKIGTEDIIIASLAGTGLRSVADLRGKRVAQLRYADFPELAADPLIGKYDTNNYAQSVNMLLEGRVDAAIGLHTSLLHALRRNPRAISRLAPLLTLRSAEFSIFISRAYRDAATIERLRTAAKSMVERRVFERLRDIYRKNR